MATDAPVPVVIRSERVRDFRGIAQVHAEAFDHALGMGEVALVDVLRHGASYASELALVAELHRSDTPASTGCIPSAFTVCWRRMGLR